MARKEIKAIFNDNELNKMNSNFKELYDDFGNVVDTVTEKAFDKVVDSAKINWGEPVDTFDNLPSNASNSETRMTRDDGKIYRFDGSIWKEIQDIDPTAINEVDNRLSSSLADTEKDKISHGEVSVHDINKNKGKLDQTYMSDDFLQQMAGETPINSVPANESITMKKLANKSVDPRKTTFLGTGKNLFDGNYIGIAIGGGDDNPKLLYDSDYRGFILEVNPNTTYTIQRSNKTTDIFSIAGHESFPEDGERLNRWIKQGGSDKSTTSPYDDNFDYFTFKTTDKERYIIVWTTNNHSEPDAMVEVGGFPSPYKEYDLDISFNVKSPNIRKGKNLFKGDYVNGYIEGNTDRGGSFIQSEDYKSAIIPVKPNVTYTLTKTKSNRFRIAFTQKYPKTGDTVRFVRDGEYYSDNETTFTLTTENGDYIMIVYVARHEQAPDFMQVELGGASTSLETYGYKFEPMAKDYRSVGVIKNREHGGKVFVGDFGGEGKSDKETIQDAFDYADSDILVFEPNKIYVTDGTVTADVSKVRGIEGQNSLIEIKDSDVDVLKYKGGKTTGSANPREPLNIELSYTEMNPFIRDLRIGSSKGSYIGNGIVFDGTYGLRVDGCHLFNLRHGIKVVGLNRNFILSNNNIWNNSGYGVFWDNTNVHQQNLTGNHISYCLRALYLENSDMHNLQVIGNDIEGANGPAYESPESLIHVHLDESPYYFEAIHIVGNSLQDHGANVAPLLNFDSRNKGIQDLIIGNNQVANSAQDSLYMKGVDRATINGNSFKNNHTEQSIKMEGANSHIAISGNHLDKGVAWSDDTTKTSITGNVANGFSLNDSNDGKVLVANNI